MTPSLGASSGATRYRFQRRIAIGGMAELYLGEAVAAGGVRKQVALKQILPQYSSDAEFVEMFLTEARLASTLQHPNIVQTYDVVQVRGQYAIIMEFLEGMDLQEFRRVLAAQKQALSIAQVLHVADRALAALHYAHERKGPDGEPLGLVHRDISPHNLFVTRDGGVKLIDFGVAKAAKHLTNTKSGVLKGKVLYMSPEHCQGLEVDGRTDVFSVGTMLYRLITGKYPHQGRNAYDTMRAIVKDQPVPPSTHQPGVPAGLDAIVLKALEKRVEDRYQTARDMQRDLADVIRSENMFVHDAEFAQFVENALAQHPLDQDPRDLENLPSDLVIGLEPIAEFLNEDSDLDAPTEEVKKRRTFIDNESAILERHRDVWLLRLRGPIDERLDVKPLVALISNTLVVDTQQVTGVTSFGIRALLELFDEARSRTDAIFHRNASPMFLEQASMVHGLLGGGRVLSFALPYLDTDTGEDFRLYVEGEEAAAVIRTMEPPVPDGRNAEFDDDMAEYIFFSRQFEQASPPHVAEALAVLGRGDLVLEVEKQIDGTGTQIWIRRPLSKGFRWKQLRGLEGAVRLDLSGVTSWEGVNSFVDTLSLDAEDLQNLTVVSAPGAVAAAIAAVPELAEKLTFETVRLQVPCRRCRVPRQVLVQPAPGVPIDQLAVPPGESCDRCGTSLSPEPAPPPSPAARRALPWSIGFVVLLSAAALAAGVLLYVMVAR